jgi:hypothetical protein
MHRSIRRSFVLSFLFLSLVLALATLSGVAFAQQPGQMDPAEMMKYMQDPAAMQRMAQQAEAAQRCMKDIDQKKLEALQKRAEATSREVDKLCKAGKKDEAMTRAIDLAKELRDDATIKKVRECTKGMSEMMKDMPWAQMPGMIDEEPDPSKDDICS